MVCDGTSESVKSLDNIGEFSGEGGVMFVENDIVDGWW